MLVHEGYFLIELPLLCAYLLVKRGTAGSFNLGRLLRFILLPTVITIAGLIWGRYEPGIDSLVAWFESNPLYQVAALNGAVDRDSLLVIVRSVQDNLDFNSNRFRMVPWFDFLLIGAWFASFPLFYYRLFSRNKLPRDLLFYSAFSPILMNLIACDYFRWVSLASINMFIVFLLRVESKSQTDEPITVPWSLNTILILGFCLLGPISDTRAFPLLIMNLKYIREMLFIGLQ